jgi:uncharacterized protein YfaS (alpha-2-macroglobulin family)
MSQKPKRWIGYCLLPGLLGLSVLAILAVYFGVRRYLPQNSPGQVLPPGQDTSSTGVTPVTDSSIDQGGLSVQLSEGQALPQTPEPLTLAAGEPLSTSQILSILNRLPEFSAQAEDGQEFKLPAQSLPPPRSGQTIPESFPASAAATPPEQATSGPLEVLRYAPEGEIPLAPFINITFNQPMVPLTTLSGLAAQDVPVVVQPEMPGTWRWVGTKTLTFEYASELIDRLPKAAEFTVTIPAGTRSATGGVLAQDVTWTFTTPPPAIVSNYPSSDPQPRDPLFFIAFDQRIEPQSVLQTVKVTAENQAVTLELLAISEVQADKTLKRLADNAGEDRWLAFRATKLLPADTDITVQVGPGTPSAEGPLLTQQAQSFSFHTYAPLRIEDHGCSWSSDKCPPLTPFYIRFNNPVDATAYKEDMLRIDPELQGASVNIFGNTIQIRGATQGQTTYHINVDGNLQDVFGQKLGESARLTFKVGSAEPFLVGPEKTLVTLDPAASRQEFSVFAMNYNKLDVRIYVVQPADWPAFKEYRRNYNQEQPPQPPGRKVLDKTINIETTADTLSEAKIDLSEVMDGDFGQFVVIVEPHLSLFQLNKSNYRQIVQAWVQVTQIGLDAFADPTQMLVWATALRDGTPLAGVSVESSQQEIKVTTANDGTARFTLPAGGISYLVARQGQDTAILPPSEGYWDTDSWQPRSVNDQLRWYVFDDRQMYRPGEEVHLKGWLRLMGGKTDGDIGLVGNAVKSISYQVTESMGNQIAAGQVEVNALGGFDFVLSLPENTNLGYAQVSLTASGVTGGLGSTSYTHSFQIQEFRRPEFEVSARNETSGPFFAGEHAMLAVAASYYAGGPLPNAEVTWQVSSAPSTYRPPNWPDFVFGYWTPWWENSIILSSEASPGSFAESSAGGVQTFTGTTDAAGEHYLRLDFNQFSDARPYSLLAQASVMDVNRQAWTSATSLLVHPASLYVGLRSERTFVERGTPLEIQLIVTDLDGNPVADRPIRVRASRLEWKYRGANWSEEEVDVHECQVGSTLEPVSCTFETKVGGRYQITAEVSDGLGRPNRSQFTRWVSGGGRPPARNVEQEAVTLIPDKESYQPGDVARILVQPPFTPAEGLLTVSRSGVLYTQRFRIEEGTHTLQVPIEETHIPNLNVQVDLVGSAPRLDDQGEVLLDVPARPAYASGQLNLSIPPLQRTLALLVIPEDKEIEPGGATAIDVTVTDAHGEPVSDAGLAVVVVDEAILALTNYQLSDPVAVFYQNRPSDLYSRYLRSSIVLADPLALTAAAQAEGRGLTDQLMFKSGEVEAVMEAPMPTMTAAPSAAGAPAQAESIRVRSDFNPLAIFAPSVRTDVSGYARVDVKVPDNLTRYRVMVVAVAGDNHFGSGESSLVARLPLMVRPSAPRFLNFGDQFELPVVLQNQTSEPMQVEVVLQTANIKLTGNQGLQVTVPGRDRLEVRFPATTLMPGTARFQIAAVSGSYADAATVEIPVYTPATTEAFATYGVVDDGAVLQPFAAPQGVYPQFGGLEITTSSTALQALSDAVLYLFAYPYECSEQLSSRILAIASLRDVLTAFSAEGLPSSEGMVQAVERDITRLQAMQNSDGGFPYWQRGRDSIPFNTIHAALALQKAKLKGFEVPSDIQQRSLVYLENIEDHYPSWYSLRTRQTLSAYALYVRHVMGDTDREKARNLLEQAGLEKLSLDAVGWLWQVLADDPASTTQLDAIRRHVNNRAVETAGAANFTTGYDEQAYLLLESNRRTDAILLDALIVDNPQNDLIPKLVNGLLAHRTRGRWGSTQENVFVLLALDHYFSAFEAQPPDFVARLWLGDTYAGESQFTGYSTDRHETQIPMNYLLDQTAAAGVQNLVLSKEGTGRLYYRLGLRYSPTDLQLDPLDMGFVVQRVYEAIDDPQDVTRDSDGIWHIKAGARVRVHLTMVADNRRYHVALSDPLPAGLEIVNPALAVSGSVPQDPNSSGYRYGWWWWGTWYEHQNMRDQRAEAFTSLLWEGVYTYTYVTRATTPGTFVVPPAKAEEMYSPEVFGRSASDVVIVK